MPMRFVSGRNVMTREPPRYFAALSFFVIAEFFRPAQCGVIIMRTCIDYAVFIIVIRQIGIIGVAAKGELQNFHAGKLKLVS